MQRNTPEKQHAAGLERWESWPLWALGLSNGTNIMLWYVLSMARINAPELPIRVERTLTEWLPLIAVVGGVAAAVSLDGVLIATIAGARHGRRGLWSWLTILGAAVFSGAIAYAVHAGQLDRAPGLHVAQAVVLALYNLHLSQPRKALQSENDLSANCIADTERQNGDRPKRAFPDMPHQDGVRCRACGDIFPSTEAVRQHRRDSGCGSAKLVNLHRDLSVEMQHVNGNSTHDTDGV